MYFFRAVFVKPLNFWATAHTRSNWLWAGFWCKRGQSISILRLVLLFHKWGMFVIIGSTFLVNGNSGVRYPNIQYYLYNFVQRRVFYVCDIYAFFQSIGVTESVAPHLLMIINISYFISCTHAKHTPFIAAPSWIVCVLFLVWFIGLIHDWVILARLGL